MADSRTRSTSARRGRLAGDAEERSAAAFASRTASASSTTIRPDRDLVEDRPGEDPRRLAPGALGRHELREPGQGDEDVLALLGGRPGRTGPAAVGGLGDSLPDPPELDPLPPADREEEDGDEEARAEGDPSRRVRRNGASCASSTCWLIASRTKPVGAPAGPTRRPRRRTGSRRRGAAKIEPDARPPSLEDLRPGAWFSIDGTCSGDDLAVGEHDAVGAMSVTRAPVWRATAPTFS